MEFVANFRSALVEAGLVEDQNIKIEYRFAEGRYDKYPELVSDLLDKHVAVIVAATGNNGVMAAKSATSRVPIVFLSGMDPVTLGLVASLGRPGGNATGVSMYVSGLVKKRLELPSEVIPPNTNMAALVNPTNPNSNTVAKDAQEAGGLLGHIVRIVKAGAENELEQAFQTMRQEQDAAVLVSPDAFFIAQHKQVVALAAKYSIPAIYEWPLFVQVGGLMSYSPTFGELSRQLAMYAAKIVKGATPAELPVEQPTKFELVINLKTAKALGLTVPPALLARADEVIE
jgi:putative ABC transport system substrate-binding protein